MLVPTEDVGHDCDLDEALDDHIREQGTSKIVAYGRELSGLYWLDSIVVLLTLGHMGILMHAAALTSACIATAFLLVPRRAGDGLARAQRPARCEDGRPRARRQVDPTGAIMDWHGDQGSESQPGLSSMGEAVELGAAEAAHVEGVAVLPALQAHWAVLGQEGLPAAVAVDLVLGLVAWSSERRRRVEGVLNAYFVPLGERDGSNLVTGLLRVHPEALPKGQLSVARGARRHRLGGPLLVHCGVGGGGEGGVALDRCGGVCGGCHRWEGAGGRGSGQLRGGWPGHGERGEWSDGGSACPAGHDGCGGGDGDAGRGGASQRWRCDGDADRRGGGCCTELELGGGGGFVTSGDR